MEDDALHGQRDSKDSWHPIADGWDELSLRDDASADRATPAGGPRRSGSSNSSSGVCVIS